MKIEARDTLLITFMTLIGLFVRLSPALSVSFPLNDGGLFYNMILDLQENHFSLPLFTSYNHTNIPFAYPPFSFYLYGILSSLGHIPVLKLMQFLPAFTSALTIPVFFLFAREVLGTKSQVLLSVLVFSLVPRAFDWLIMGGGTTRSMGFLFALLSMYQAIRLFTKPDIKNLLLTTLFSGLVILTHPEAAIHTLIACSFIYVWKDLTIRGFKRASFVAFGSLLISSPWWANVLLQHNIEPFRAVLSSAGQDSYNLIVRLFQLFQFDFTDEPFLPLISMFGLIGIFATLAGKRPALFIWVLLIQMIEPRGGSLYMMVPLSMLAGIGLDQSILPLMREPEAPGQSDAWLKINLEKIFIGFIFLYGILSTTVVTAKISQQLTLTPADLQAFKWVQNHVPANSQFILITRGVPLNDASSEWFPALTEHTSIATIFGQEWVNSREFGDVVGNYKKLQSCGTQGIDCLNEWAEASNAGFSFIYFRKIQGTSIESTTLLEQLERSNEYQMIYQTQEVEIFEKK